MMRKTGITDYSSLLYTRIKSGVHLPVPTFEKAFACALRHDSNPLLCFSRLGEGSEADDGDDDEDGSPTLERIIAFLTPRMACKMFWQGLALCKKLDGEAKTVPVNASSRDLSRSAAMDRRSLNAGYSTYVFGPGDIISSFSRHFLVIIISSLSTSSRQPHHYKLH